MIDSEMKKQMSADNICTFDVGKGSARRDDGCSKHKFLHI